VAAKDKKNLNESIGRIGDQFQNLDMRDPGLWPAIPRYALCLLVVVLTAAVVWFFFVQKVMAELDEARQKEETLRQEYKTKVAKAVNLDALKQQLEEVQQYVALLERQLPSEAEMDALLSDISQAGYARGLQVNLFRPNQVVVQDYYAELPISIKGSGKFHDVANFAADVANLSRIVTLNNITMNPAKDNGSGTGELMLEATAKTFRYLDEKEIEAQRQAKQKKDKK
jgi:pilus assembly protein, pilO